MREAQRPQPRTELRTARKRLGALKLRHIDFIYPLGGRPGLSRFPQGLKSNIESRNNVYWIGEPIVAAKYLRRLQNVKQVLCSDIEAPAAGIRSALYNSIIMILREKMTTSRPFTEPINVSASNC